MSTSPIGILDSGLGGLSVWRKIASHLPQEAIIYIGDARNAPYGRKSSEEIYLLSKSMIHFLVSQKVKLIIIACNTITVTCLDRLRTDFPQIPLIGTVPVIKTAVRESKNGQIGLLATTKTAKSLYVQRLLTEFANNTTVIIVGTDELVPLIEQGEQESSHVKNILSRILRPFSKRSIDVLILGCTHFPFIQQEIQTILGSTIKILDSGEAIARQVERVLRREELLSTEKKGADTFYTSGEIGMFTTFLHQEIREVFKSDQVRQFPT